MLCIICGCKDFSLHDGIFYCNECSTQIEETRDEQTDEISFSRKTLLSSPSPKKSSSIKDTVKYSEWITIEAYNYILFLQVEALIKLGASPELKPTILHIWSKYLQKCEIAFQSSENKPRLGPAPSKRDLKVLYGDRLLSVRKRKTSISKSDEETQAETTGSEESDLSDEGLVSGRESYDSSSSKSSTPKYSPFARKLLHKRKLNSKNRTAYSNKVFQMNLKKTLSFCYLGLLFTEDQLRLSDLIRLTCEERIPFINIVDKLPPTMNLQHSDTATFLAYSVPGLMKIHKTAFDIIKFLNLPKCKLPSIHLSVSCFLKDLNLPDDISPMVKVLFDEFQSKFIKSCDFSTEDIPTDLLALSFILIVLKMLFVLDGEFEIEHSKVMKKLNANYPHKKYFVWSEWREQASLKEYLFLAENPGFCTVSKLDSLWADRMISKYPYTQLKPPSSEDTIMYRNKTVSKHEIKTIISSMINLSSVPKIPPTSFPLKSAIKHFESEWRTLPMFQETKELDFSLLKKDFSSCSLSFKPMDMNDGDELCYHLLTSLYLSKSSNGSNFETDSPSSKLHSNNTAVKYWFFNTYKHNIDAGLVTGNWDKNIPSIFKWLLNFFAKCTYVEPIDLYVQMVKIEKLLILRKRRFRKLIRIPCHLETK